MLVMPSLPDPRSIAALAERSIRGKGMMPKSPKSQTLHGPDRQFATAEDVARVLGNLDATKMLPILELRPSIADLEEASVWLGGDSDVFGPGPPIKGVASQIVTILTADEEEHLRSG